MQPETIQKNPSSSPLPKRMNLCNYVHVLQLLRELPNRSLTWRAYATTALAHLVISDFNLLESISFSAFPGSTEISMKEKQRSNRPRFATSPSTTASPLLRERDFFTDIVLELPGCRLCSKKALELLVLGELRNLAGIYMMGGLNKASRNLD